MSYGERSCKQPCRKPVNLKQNDYGATCNVDCKWYLWDGVTPPDSVTSKEPPPISGKDYRQENRERLKKYLRK